MGRKSGRKSENNEKRLEKHKTEIVLEGEKKENYNMRQKIHGQQRLETIEKQQEVIKDRVKQKYREIGKGVAQVFNVQLK